MKTRGVSFVEAVKELAAPAGITIEEREITPEEKARFAMRADLHTVVEAACRFFEQALLVAPKGAPARAYLAQRGISLDTARKYRMGFALPGWNTLSDHLQKNRYPLPLAFSASLVKKSERDSLYDVFRNRLIFPILDDRGRVVAFGGRQMPGDDKGPKYLNSPESEIYEKKKVLYGLSWARGAVQRKDRLILVEGYFDAVSLWQAGFEEAVATCGTALTGTQIETVRRLTRRVVALFDSDEAGLNAATKSMGLFIDAGVEAQRLELGEAKDPDEFVQKNGAEAFEGLLARAEPLVELVVRRTFEKEGASPEGKRRALQALIPLLQRLPDLLRLKMISDISGKFGVENEATLTEMVSGRGAAPAPPSPAMTPSAPTRWAPSKDVTHLLWLVVHFPTQVGPVLAETDPDIITDRREVLEALALLMSGAPVSEVADRTSDRDLARVLIAVAARMDEYQEEAAKSAASEIVSRMELARVEAEITSKNAQIAHCITCGDKSSYALLKQDISLLQVRRASLKVRMARRRSG